MTRRILAITIANVLAALGTAGGLFLVLSAESRAQDRISNPITVAIAAVRIPIGTSGAKIRAEDMVRLVRMPKGLGSGRHDAGRECRAGQTRGHLEHRLWPGVAPSKLRRTEHCH